MSLEPVEIAGVVIAIVILFILIAVGIKFKRAISSWFLSLIFGKEIVVPKSSKKTTSSNNNNNPFSKKNNEKNDDNDPDPKSEQFDDIRGVAVVVKIDENFQDGMNNKNNNSKSFSRLNHETPRTPSTRVPSADATNHNLSGNIVHHNNQKNVAKNDDDSSCGSPSSDSEVKNNKKQGKSFVRIYCRR